MADLDFIIVGGGLAGLSCALKLQKSGAKFLLLEKEARVGGRVKTRSDKGFVIDEGFQVLLDSYPELDHVVNRAQLNLQKFNSGALIFDGSSMKCLANPLVHPNYVAHSLFQDFISIKDKFLTLKLIFEAKSVSEDSYISKISTRDYLKSFGFSENFVSSFWEPFLTGVFLDPELNVDSNFFKFLVSFFSNGRVSIPAQGMQQLPLKIAQALPSDCVKTNQSIETYDHQQVTLKSGEVIKAKQVIIAFDDSQDHTAEDYHSVTTYYFSGSDINKLNWDKWLVLVPKRLGFAINHMSILSHVSSTYSNDAVEKPLLSVSTVGKNSPEPQKIIKEIEQISQLSLDLKLIDMIHVKKALPKINIESVKQKVNGFEIKNKIIYCGDKYASPSINGALKSGRLAAEYALRN